MNRNGHMVRQVVVALVLLGTSGGRAMAVDAGPQGAYFVFTPRRSSSSSG